VHRISIPTKPRDGEFGGHIATIRWFSSAGGVITIFFKPAVVVFLFLNWLTSLTAQQMNDKTRMDANMKSALFPDFR
jgi:hypothetical protein